MLDIEGEKLRQLWCAVIVQAIEDATTPLGKDSRVNLDIRQARDWLTKPSKGFADACRLAGYEPDRIRAQATKRIAEAEARGSISTKRNPAYTCNGQSLTLTEWSKQTGIPRATLANRVQTHGWTIERAISKPKRHRRTDHTITEQANA